VNSWLVRFRAGVLPGGKHGILFPIVTGENIGETFSPP
jgi:hypothetical protein